MFDDLNCKETHQWLENICAVLSFSALIAGLMSWLTILEAVAG
jgi:hypothetical protein